MILFFSKIDHNFALVNSTFKIQDISSKLEEGGIGAGRNFSKVECKLKISPS